MIFVETSNFGRVTKPKHAKSGLCSRRINLRKRLNLIDCGVESAARSRGEVARERGSGRGREGEREG